MTSEEYEGFVGRVIEGLDCLRHAKLDHNRVFDGVRQPGKYEIDISLEIPLGEVASVLLIVECKNWVRRVDRPVIQKLVQTRDAIAAHKAAVVSPKGFSSEAVKVARVHGVALWVVTKTTFHTVLHAGEGGRRRLDALDLFVRQRRLLLAALNYSPYEAYNLVNLPLRFSGSYYDRDVDCDDVFQEPGFDRRATPCQIVNIVISELKKHLHDHQFDLACSARIWFENAERDFVKFGFSETAAQAATETVAASDIEEFRRLVERNLYL